MIHPHNTTLGRLKRRVLQHQVISVLFLSALLLSCSGSGNGSNAQLHVETTRPYLLFTGKRDLMVHDPISLLLNKKYTDTLIVPLNAAQDSIIKGETIPVKHGYCPYNGFVSIKRKRVVVKLATDNLSTRTRDSSSFNGTYNLTTSK